MKIARNDKDCVELISECREDVDQFLMMVMACQMRVILDDTGRIKGLRIYKKEFPKEEE